MHFLCFWVFSFCTESAFLGKVIVFVHSNEERARLWVMSWKPNRTRIEFLNGCTLHEIIWSKRKTINFFCIIRHFFMCTLVYKYLTKRSCFDWFLTVAPHFFTRPPIFSRYSNVILTDLDFFINPLLKFSKNKFWKLGEFRFIEMQYLVLWQ